APQLARSHQPHPPPGESHRPSPYMYEAAAYSARLLRSLLPPPSPSAAPAPPRLLPPSRLAPVRRTAPRRPSALLVVVRRGQGQGQRRACRRAVPAQDGRLRCVRASTTVIRSGSCSRRARRCRPLASHLFEVGIPEA
uniref:Uncharacterized protein n=2 Tax=Aegilops tauschii subsp. strangulata TaxID=200361 RepID=A0A453Q4F5_AEGTS